MDIVNKVTWNVYNIVFSEGVVIPQVEDFCTSLLGENSPCKFHGFVNKIDDTHFLLNVIDMNNFDLMNVEVFEDIILVHLCDDAEDESSINRFLNYCKTKIDENANIIHKDKDFIYLGHM